MKLFRVVLLATLVVAVSVASSASFSRGDDVVLRLTDLLPDHPCDVICVDCQGDHTIITEPGPLPANAWGTQQEWCESGSCAQHQCGVAWSSEFEDALLAATPTQLRQFAAANPNRVSVNEKREAIQIVGCKSLLVASFSLRSGD